MRAPYVNKDGFRFTIYRKGIFSDLGKLLGMQDIAIGEREFDDAFIIKGNDETKLRRLFGDRKIRQLIEQQPKIYLAIRDDEGWFKVQDGQLQWHSRWAKGRGGFHGRDGEAAERQMDDRHFLWTKSEIGYDPTRYLALT